jgi:hypothetical protein
MEEAKISQKGDVNDSGLLRGWSGKNGGFPDKQGVGGSLGRAVSGGAGERK